jgi:hypothetical protein
LSVFPLWQGTEFRSACGIKESVMKKSVYQFKLALLGVEPSVWRRIQVPDTYTFYELHVAIQDAMGWLDCHLHAFRVRAPDTGDEVTIGFPDDEGFGPPFLPGWELAISDFFHSKNSTAFYEYDFGDGWEHQIALEEVFPREAKVKYPRCLDGERACPPEDCGGVGGYENFLDIIGDPTHEEHEDMLEWIGGKFNPAAFDPKKIRFDSPRKRLEMALGGDVF